MIITVLAQIIKPTATFRKSDARDQERGSGPWQKRTCVFSLLCCRWQRVHKQCAINSVCKFCNSARIQLSGFLIHSKVDAHISLTPQFQLFHNFGFHAHRSIVKLAQSQRRDATYLCNSWGIWAVCPWETRVHSGSVTLFHAAHTGRKWGKVRGGAS